MMKLSAISLLVSTASAANASLRGGPVARSSNADLTAVLPAPFLFVADSIRVGNSTCEAELEQLGQNFDLMAAYQGLNSCASVEDDGSKTYTIDFASCNATAAVNTACPCEFVFHLGNEMSS